MEDELFQRAFLAKEVVRGAGLLDDRDGRGPDVRRIARAVASYSREHVQPFLLAARKRAYADGNLQICPPLLLLAGGECTPPYKRVTLMFNAAGRLKGEFPHLEGRAVKYVYFAGLEDANARADELRAIVAAWIAYKK